MAHRKPPADPDKERAKPLEQLAKVRRRLIRVADAMLKNTAAGGSMREFEHLENKHRQLSAEQARLEQQLA